MRVLPPQNDHLLAQGEGNRCFGASLPTRISASWFGSVVGSIAYNDLAR
jgi:hypothetical protein